MQRKSLVIFFLFVLMNSFFIYGIYAQTPDVPLDAPSVLEGGFDPFEAVDAASIAERNAEDLSEDDEVDILVEEAQGFTEELSVDSGLTPDSPFYFIDNVFDGFADPSEVREEKIAEMAAMAQAGKIDDARIAFEKYKKYADQFERDVSPEQREEAISSSEAIRGTFVREIAQNVGPTEKDEFVKEIMLGEQDIVTAAEIAGKIEELCKQLSKLDPNEYARVCSTGVDAPDWRKNLDRDLTEEQKEEALKFGEIMSQCFETAGQTCKCEEISYPDFAEACSIAAPLATACEIENNEDACQQLDDLEMPQLPDYLQDIMDQIEGGIQESQFDLYMPIECQEAKVTSPKECAKIMIQTHAPEECKPALLAANVQNEREARKICEKIMFEQNAPEECVAAGVTNPKECGKIMFQTNAPQECLDAGITGENRDDPRKCGRIMMAKFGGPEGGCAPGTICVPGSQYAPGTGPNIRMSGGNCAGIQDPQERLKCYDGAGQYVQEYRGNFEERFRDTQNLQRKCAEDCRAKNSAWDFSNGNCVCRAPPIQYQDNFRQDFNQDFRQEFRGDFSGGQFIPPTNFQPPEGFQYPDGYIAPPQGFTSPDSFQQPSQDFQQPSGSFPSPDSFQPPTISTTPTTAPAPSSSPSSEPSPVTGGVISDNGFLRYWFWG